MSPQQPVPPTSTAPTSNAPGTSRPDQKTNATPAPGSGAPASRVVVGSEPAIILLDDHRRIVAARPSCALLFGRSQNELAGLRLESLLKNGVHADLEKFLHSAGAAGQGEYKTTVKVIVLKKDGSEVPAQCTLKRLWNHPQYCWTAAFQENGPATTSQLPNSFFS